MTWRQVASAKANEKKKKKVKHVFDDVYRIKLLKFLFTFKIKLQFFNEQVDLTEPLMRTQWHPLVIKLEVSAVYSIWIPSML